MTTHDTWSIRRGRLLAVLVAAAAAVVVWLVAHQALGVDLRARAGAAVQQVSLPAVIAMALVIGLLGWAVLAVLEKLSAKSGRTVWTIVAVVVLMVSLLGPLGGVTTGAVVTLLCLHLVVGLALIVGLGRTAARRRRAGAA